MLHLVTFGGLALESVNEAVAPRVSAQRIAILAVLAAEGDRRVSRERLTGLFWPDSDEERARHSLRQALYALRQELGRDIVRSEFVVSLDTSAITSDVGEFRAALLRGDRQRAATLARGPFLDGFYLPSAPAFQRWVEDERARWHANVTTNLVSLAVEATAEDDLDAAIASWRRLTALDPLSGRFALSLLKALAARGDRAEALAFAKLHATLVRRELESDVDPEIRRLEADLRRMPAPPMPADVAPIVVSSRSVSASASAPETAAVAEPAPNASPRPRAWWRVGSAPALAAVVASLALVAWSVAWLAGKNSTAPGALGKNGRTGEQLASQSDTATTRSATAYRLYQEGVRAYYVTDFPTASRLIDAALQDDSTFAMAAYYRALLTEGALQVAATSRALRLAERAPERERLFITADLLTRHLSPNAISVAETLATRYPNDPRALETLARAKTFAGDWAPAAAAFERAIAIDSAAPRLPGTCHYCEDFMALADVYYWWDSLPAARRVAWRYVRARPSSTRPWELMMWTAAKAGDADSVRVAFRRYTELGSDRKSAVYEVKLNLMLEAYDNVERDLRPFLESPKTDDFSEAHWWLLIALRNQGRLRDALRFNETGTLPRLPTPQVSPLPVDDINSALLALENGDAATAVSLFTRRRLVDSSTWPPGLAARYLAWSGTLAGMAIAATGDTAALLRMADTVEYWGQRSAFGRDQKAHHYLRGMVHVAAGRDQEAVLEFRRAMFSRTLGFTRVNLELARALLRLNRPSEAVDVLEPALRGEIDAANLYVTRMDLHEALAQAFDRLGQRDRAAEHYRAIVTAWANADPRFHARREAARQWLVRAPGDDAPAVRHFLVRSFGGMATN